MLRNSVKTLSETAHKSTSHGLWRGAPQRESQRMSHTLARCRFLELQTNNRLTWNEIREGNKTKNRLKSNQSATRQKFKNKKSLKSTSWSPRITVSSFKRHHQPLSRNQLLKTYFSWANRGDDTRRLMQIMKNSQLTWSTHVIMTWHSLSSLLRSRSLRRRLRWLPYIIRSDEAGGASTRPKNNYQTQIHNKNYYQNRTMTVLDWFHYSNAVCVCVCVCVCAPRGNGNSHRSRNDSWRHF